MKKILAVMLLLAGCKSTEAFMDRAPSEVFHTTAAPKDVAYCIGQAEHSPYQDQGDGKLIVRISTIYGGSAEAFTVSAEGHGSLVEYRKTKGLMEDRKLWIGCMR